MSANSSPPAVLQDTKSVASNKTASGTSSPTKNAKARTSPMKTNSPKTPSLVSAKKTTRAALQNKSAEDLCGQILELKKTLASANDEKNGLKAKLRRLEEESNKKSEAEKNSTNSVINNLKRKIQRLETTLKDKENLIKKLQNDVKVAKRAPESATENSAGKRPLGSPHESTRPTPTKNGASLKSPTGRWATPGKGQDQNVAVVEETKQLRSWLRRALGIEPTSDKYEERSNLELIAEIQKLTEELRLHKKVDERGNLQDPPSDWKAKEIMTAEELEKLKTELTRVKEDRVEYYCAMENKDAEVAKLTEELKKVQKDRNNGKERLERNRPGTFVRKPSTPGSKTGSVKAADPSSAPPRPSPQTRTTHSGNQKVAVGNESPAKRISNVKPKLNTTTTISKQTGGVTKSTTITIKKTSKVKQMVVDAQSGDDGKTTEVEGIKNASVENKALVSPEEIESFRVNLAAKKIQKSWKQHQTKEEKPEKTERINGNESEEAVRDFQENRAAKVIQKGWKESRAKESPDKDLDEAVMTIQATARGHAERTEHMTSMKGASGDSVLINRNGDADDLDASATVIQAAARAHHTREEMLQKWEGSNGNGDVLHNKSVPS